MERSPIGRLPPELRNEIYKLVLTCHTDVVLSFDAQRVTGKYWQFDSSRYSLSVTKTCKVICRESLSLFQACNSFHLRGMTASQITFAGGSFMGIGNPKTGIPLFITPLELELELDSLKIPMKDMFSVCSSSLDAAISQLYRLHQDLFATNLTLKWAIDHRGRDVEHSFELEFEMGDILGSWARAKEVLRGECESIRWKLECTCVFIAVKGLEYPLRKLGILSSEA